MAFSSFWKLPTFHGSCPYSISKASNGLGSLFHTTSLWIHLYCLLLPLIRALLWLHWATQIIQDNHLSISRCLITPEKSPVLHEVAYSQVPGIRMWASLGSLFCLPHRKVWVIKKNMFLYQWGMGVDKHIGKQKCLLGYLLISCTKEDCNINKFVKHTYNS